MSVARVREPTPYDALHVRLMLGIRKRHQWTQAQLAEELGLCHSTIQRWERGCYDPHPVWLTVFSQLLGD